MNQVEQWFSIPQRKRFRVADLTCQEDMQAKIMPCIAEWDQHAHPFHWSTTSVAKVLADAPTKRVA
jgi:hypothetical protein